MPQHVPDFVPSLEKFTMCLFGLYYTFKTFMVGALLEAELKAGGEVQFWNTAGEEGYDKTLSHFPDVCKHVYHVRDYKDYKEGVTDLEKKPLAALGIDQFGIIAEWINAEWVESGLLPFEKKGREEGESGPAQWMRYGRDLRNRARDFRLLAKRIAVTCPMRLSGDELDTREKIPKADMVKVPAVPGSVRHDMIGWFDYVGYCETKLAGGKIHRFLHFEPMKQVDTKARLRRQMTEPIRLPDGPGAWDIVIAAFEEHMK